MLITSITINKPMESVFVPVQSILPERFRTITTPSYIPIVSEDLTSVTEPSIVIDSDNFESIQISES